MPRVEELEPQGSSGDRFRIRLSDGSECVISRAAVRRLGLSPGSRLSEDEAARLVDEGRYQEGLDAALRYLSYRERSRSELERYLRRKGYEDPILTRVVARCRELDYVDDRRFAESWVRDRIRLKPRGVFRLKAELREKGVSEDDAEAGIRRAFDEADVTERDLLETAARKRWRERRSDDPRTVRRRLYGYLDRRGFPAHEIREVVDDLMDDELER